MTDPNGDPRTDPKQGRYANDDELAAFRNLCERGEHGDLTPSEVIGLAVRAQLLIDELTEERDNAYHRGYNAAIEDAEAISDVLSDSVDLTLDMTEDEVRAYRRGLRWFVRSIADLRHQVGTEREETTDADT
jgi:hypothetical protein